MVIRDRVIELRRVKASSLKPSPANWRTHPKAQQDAMRGVLSEIGYAGALLARTCDDGTLELIDGHLRSDLTPDMEVPVLVLDVDEREARYLLATHDPLAAMATSNNKALAALLADVSSGDAAVQAMLAGIYQPSIDSLCGDVGETPSVPSAIMRARIPSKSWLRCKDEIIEAFTELAKQYGIECEWPD